jgi:hypothetical protein
LAVAGASSAAAPAAESPSSAVAPPVRVPTTGNNSELLETIPIRHRPGAGAVVMSLPTGSLEGVERLSVSAELEVSVSCRSRGSGCIGRPYAYNPAVTAQLVLGSQPRATRASGTPLGAPKTLHCSQRLPNRNHHCVIVIPGVEAQLDELGKLPCDPPECFVNLAVSAANRLASAKQVLIIGSDNDSGAINGDKGRINLTRLTADGPATATTSIATEPSRSRLAVVDRGRQPNDQVVFSVKLPDLEAGEHLEVDGAYVARIRRLPYNVFIGSELVLSERPRGVTRIGLPLRAAELRGQVAEGNGSNCTQGPSAFSNPCRVRKVGVLTITKNLQQPLYLNLVTGLAAQSGGDHHVDDAARLVGGFLRVTRYAASDSSRP